MYLFYQLNSRYGGVGGLVNMGAVEERIKGTASPTPKLMIMMMLTDDD